MSDYNWAEILASKTDEELANILNNCRTEPQEKIDAALNELNKRGINISGYKQMFEGIDNVNSNDGVRKFQIIGAVTAIILVILFFVIRIVPMNIDYDLAKILSTIFTWVARIIAVALTCTIADKLNRNVIGWAIFALFIPVIALFAVSAISPKNKKKQMSDNSIIK